MSDQGQDHFEGHTARSSVYFRDALAVFEGGGIRGLAYAGACRAAEEWGVRFRAAIGTSVGAIAAALVAAGLRGDRFAELLRELPLDQFTAAPIKLEGTCAKLASRIARCGGSPLVTRLTHAYFAGGCYSSEPVEKWLESILQKHLGLTERVLFKHLPYALTVVACDLVHNRLKAFNREEDPLVPVAFAVRCSCSLPVFFAPVEYLDTLLVDGGVLENLPVHQLGHQDQFRYLPALAFRLQGEAQIGSSRGGGAILERLIDTAISGQSQIHLALSPPCQIVSIPTGGVSSTNFALSNEERAALYDAGYSATREFFENETAQVGDSGFLRHWLGAGMKGNVYEQTMLDIDKAAADLCMFGGDLSWTNRFWPSLWAAVRRGVRIRVLHAPDARVDRQERLRRIGCQLRESRERYAIRGSLIDSPRAAIVLEPGRTTGRVLREQTDASLIAALLCYFDRLWGDAAPTVSAAELDLLPIDPNIVIRELKQRVYHDGPAEVSFESTLVASTRPLARALETVKARGARKLIGLLQQQDRQLFQPLISRDGGTFVAPPVIECIGAEHVVIDGAHRLYECWRLGIRDIQAIIVRNGSAALPAAIGSWEHIFPQPDWLDREHRYQEYNGDQWRELKVVWKYFAMEWRGEMSA